jgi:hypothetical protein
VKSSIVLGVMRRSSLLLLAASGVTAAQVGYPPAKSPFVDLEKPQAITLIAGSFHGHRDAANVAPQGGFLLGANYQWQFAGPGSLTAEFARSASDRLLIDPAKVGAARELGTVSRPLYLADVGLALALTGMRSWHQLVPEVKAGAGFASDFRSNADSGGFKFGTRFALNWGAGVRWVPGKGSALQVRADLNNWLYTIAYPPSYYVEPANGPAVVQPTQARSFWLNNPALTLGVSYLFGR